MNVILQNVNTPEVRAISHACLLEDIPVHRTSLEMLRELFDFKQELKSGDFLPVGSVEFLREVFKIIGVNPPNGIGYLDLMKDFLNRDFEICNVSHALYTTEKFFIKPVNTKIFNGFVYDPLKPIEEYDEHDREQIEIIKGMSPFQSLIRFPVVEFQSEYRIYVDEKEIMGYARYDPYGLDDAPEPDWNIVNDMINTYNCKTTYALDVGVLVDGRTTLVEINDAWAIGLYGKALTPKQYLHFLNKRWQTILPKKLEN